MDQMVGLQLWMALLAFQGGIIVMTTDSLITFVPVKSLSLFCYEEVFLEWCLHLIKEIMELFFPPLNR